MELWHRLFPKRAVVECLTDDGAWFVVSLPDEMGNAQEMFPDSQSALLALVRYVHSQFDLVLSGKLSVEKVTPPNRYRITEVSEH